MDRGFVRLCLLGGVLVLGGCYDPSDFNGPPELLLKQKVTKMALLYDESLAEQCTDRKVQKTAVIKVGPDGHPASERWTIDQCGKSVNYIITYTPDGVGGYDYDIHAEEPAA